MKKQLLAFALGISSSLVYAGTASDQLLCKNLEFGANKLQPSVLSDGEFQKMFKEANGGFTMGNIFKIQYKPTSKVAVEGLPVLWVYTGYEETRGVDRNKINKNYTRTSVSGGLDGVKNVLAKNQDLNLNFNKHMYQDNKKGKYMYYASQAYNNGTTVVATIQEGSGTGQIHINCGVYNQGINYLLENYKDFRNVPQQ
ncbi:hypothetical protein HLH17_02280 [Acinetobacter sp. ANC 5380]|uniref:Uncharacterized protein n=1 Tax=Acinetobacter terrae TaxID=2731247 RepID=A0A7Y2RCZ7_9GAMM|nr:hypothetical protein [Acinetobacter terrae]NNH76528.1 hypothetical protein [Acinetobacter terrae]